MKRLVAFLCIVALSGLSFAFAGNSFGRGNVVAPPMNGDSVASGG